MFAVIALLALALIAASCGKLENKGTKPPNEKPKMFLVNIPPDSTEWSINPELHWFATDMDGYITTYRYIVMRADDLPQESGKPCPLCFVEDLAQNGYEGWTTINALEAPVSTSATVRLYADDECFGCYVPQYFFVQAEDNFGARSNVAYRYFSRTNHPPETTVDALTGSPFYVSTCSGFRISNAVQITWEGSDPVDYPARQPDFEYDWHLYGPFNSVSDTVGVNWDDFLADHSWNSTTNDEWITFQYARPENFFPEDIQSDTTMVGTFVMKVRTRDDAFVPDPTPGVVVFQAIRPACERDLMVVDVTMWSIWSFGELQGDCYPCGRLGYELLDEYLSYIRNLFVQAGYPPDSFFHTKIGNDSLEDPPARAAICRYKLVVLFSEDTYVPIAGEYLLRMAEYMSIGGNVMVIGRNLLRHQNVTGDGAMLPVNPSSIGYNFFAVTAEWSPGFERAYLDWFECKRDITNEEARVFLASRDSPDLPDSLRIDWDHLARLYGGSGRRQCDDQSFNHDWIKPVTPTEPTPWSSFPFKGIPDVNYYWSTGYAEGVYLISSVYGSSGPAEGGVCGYRYKTELFKSAIFGFPLYPLNEDDAVAFLKAMIEWYDVIEK